MKRLTSLLAADWQAKFIIKSLLVIVHKISFIHKSLFTPDWQAKFIVEGLFEIDWDVATEQAISHSITENFFSSGHFMLIL